MKSLAAVSLLLVLVPAPALALTVDRLIVTTPSEVWAVEFVPDEGSALQWILFPTHIQLSDGSVVPRGAGTGNASAPELRAVSTSAGSITGVFGPDPFPNNDYLFEFSSFIPSENGGVDLEVDFLDLQLSGELGSATGLLSGSGLLARDDGAGVNPVHASVPVGSVVPISLQVTLLDGVTFDPALFESAFRFEVDGAVDLAAPIPEPGTAGMVALGFAFLGVRGWRPGAPRGSHGSRSRMQG
jgi:hypothetical protein